MPIVGAETETEEQQELKNKERCKHKAAYADARDSDACVCAMHMHHEEARAALMRVTCICDWTKQTDPRVYEHSMTCDWNASLYVHGVESAVHAWT